MSAVKTRRRPAPTNSGGAIANARAAFSASRRAAQAVPVVGFGCPALDWPHHLRVLIPAARGGEVRLVEDFGIRGHSAGHPEEAERCVLPRARWNAIAEPVKREFNERLRALGLPASRWLAGENRVDRVLGLELLALAWPKAVGDEEDLGAILASWQALRPEERWWLAGRVAASPTARTARGLAMLLSDGASSSYAAPHGAGAPQREVGGLPLFSLPEPAV